MTSVTGTVGGLRVARAYLRSGLVLTALMFGSFPALILFDDRWGRPVLGFPTLPLLLVVVVVVAAHIGVVRPAGEPRSPRVQVLAVAVLALAVAGTVTVGVLVPSLGVLWFLLIGLATSVVLSTRGWRRRPDLPVTGLAVLGVVVVTVVTGFPVPADGWVRPLLLAMLVTVAPVTDLGSVGVIRVFDRLEEARRLADELATTRERVRIAAELHDVQGHSLHAIALHAELTERLVGSDPEAAAAHARTVRTLAADALAESRSLVRGYRGADLGGELRNAAGLLRAAGADASVTGDPSAVPPGHAALLGPVVREAATNVLRHSDPSRVAFVVRRAGDRTELEIRNDGVAPPSDDPPDPDGGTGLSGLAERISAAGGTVESGPDGDGGWRLRVVLLSAVSDAASGAASVPGAARSAR